MNDLQRYLRLKNLDCRKIAAATGEQYYSIVKVVKGHRNTPHIRLAIARHLGFTVNQLFGSRSISFLRSQILAEITLVAAKSAAQTEDELRAAYLPDLPRSLTRTKTAVNV